MNRRSFLQFICAQAAAGAVCGCETLNSFTPGRSCADGTPPNIVIIFADDLGYGDLGCFGHPTIKTPNLDRMAAEGMKFTQFYAAASVCTPSRAALLTGRLPIRSGMCGSRRGVLFPDSVGGLPESEITIASALKGRGYAACCIGKWHLGHLRQYLPTARGFDYYFGIPYSNDMKPTPLMQNEKTIEEPAEQSTLTKRYTQQAVGFIEQNKNRPFFLYFAHTFPHVPLFASDDFKDKSLRGLYGDVVEELDVSVGKILKTLRRYNLAEKTFVIFTSDNGPWLVKKLDGGSAGLLRGGKGTTWEGGMREPCIAWWPGKIKPGTVNTDLTCTMDIFATCLDLAAVPLPRDRVIDGVSMVSTLLGTGKCSRSTMFYYKGTRLMAVRKGPWKAHFVTRTEDARQLQEHDPPLLFNLEQDPSEKYDVAADNPDIIADIRRVVEQHRAALVPAVSQLDLVSQSSH